MSALIPQDGGGAAFTSELLVRTDGHATWAGCGWKTQCSFWVSDDSQLSRRRKAQIGNGERAIPLAKLDNERRSHM